MLKCSNEMLSEQRHLKPSALKWGRRRLHLMTSFKSSASLRPEPRCLLTNFENSPSKCMHQIDTRRCTNSTTLFRQRKLKGKTCLPAARATASAEKPTKPIQSGGEGTYLSEVDRDWPSVFSELGVLGLHQWGRCSLWQLFFHGGGTAILRNVLQGEGSRGRCWGLGSYGEHRGSLEPWLSGLPWNSPGTFRACPSARGEGNGRLTWLLDF